MAKGIPARLCPYSVYDYPCEMLRTNCPDCDIKIAALLKEKESRDILAEPSYWHTKNMPGSKI